MHIEVDQSGKIGNSQQDVVLACTGVNFQYTVCIPASVQRSFLWQMRGRVTKSTYTKLFALGLYFLAVPHVAQINAIYIDIEYPGQDDTIRRYLLNYLKRDKLALHELRIGFTFVGKKSPAHKLALATFRGELPADQRVTLEMILAKF